LGREAKSAFGAAIPPVCGLRSDIRRLPSPPQPIAEIYPAYRKSLTACPVSCHFRLESLFPNLSILIEFDTNTLLILGVFDMDLNQVRSAFE